MKQKQHIRHDRTPNLFAPPAVSEPVKKIERTIQIEFDGGTPCNIPRIGYGNGYGSYKIDNEPVYRLFFNIPMSANAAEVKTLVRAMQTISQRHDPATTALQISGDSKIALARCNGPSNWKRKDILRSGEFEIACAELATLCAQFADIKTNWRARIHSVAMFGH